VTTYGSPPPATTEPDQRASAATAPATYVEREKAVLEDLPVPLVESLHYLIGRFQVGEQSEFPRRLAVSSALHGEGVTTISRILAAVVANDLDRRVCWVDLSWRVAPASASQAEHDLGLADVVAGRAGLAEALTDTADERLSLLHSGRVAVGQPDTYARSPYVGPVLDELADRFDSLVLDVPPILASSAGLAQMRFADSYVMVVRHGVTSTQQLTAAANELKALPSLGVIVNQYKSRIPKRLVHFFVP
jgi:Mrp family chromosome partitioning ATPase